ncbi:MAG: hypothetical protein EHM88_23100 [Candidatus Rokuibacteriota bacterium]|jgi:hypothetical protein|nr:MAG: hypothetical protein EHM88_23100 [Candidatus Rokubacteria bacterium]
MTETWPALVFAGLGAFHGLNPAMGWLFAVALGMHRQSRAVVMVSLVPIAVGHAVSIAAVAGLLVAAGTIVPQNLVRTGSGLLLLGWAAYHWRYGHRHRVRFGMQTGLLGLAVWSFLMATAHGAGLMLWPVLMPSCLPGEANNLAPGGPAAAILTGVGIHTLAMVATTAVVAGLVFEWLGLALLRRAWLNVDLIWVLALVATGGLLLLF